MSLVTGTVVILQGGPSPEAAVSRVSAQAVAAALTELNQPHEIIELADDWLTQLLALQPAFVFIALHGVPGEDGSVQGVLDLLRFPYNGSGVAASALAMDKHKSKILMQSKEIGVAPGIVVEADSMLHWHDFPAVVKPVAGGSSVGVHIVQNQNELVKALMDTWQYGEALIERFIPGQELTVGVLGGKSRGVVEILPQGDTFYDYQAKYDQGGSMHHYPAEISDSIADLACKWAADAHHALGCVGAPRVDFRYDDSSEQLVVLEVNTLPGLTPTSLLPELLAHQGMSFTDFVRWQIEDGLTRTREKSDQTCSAVKPITKPRAVSG